MQSFKLTMISAGFEHGGNVTHRHLDGHSQLLVYPFESQLGNRTYNDFLSSLERVQYRYPEFVEGLSAHELYEQIIDEELKTFLRKRNASKFRECDLVMDERVRMDAFVRNLGEPPHFRRAVIEAFFKATFEAWTNCCTTSSPEKTYVGYSPAIGIDADRIIRDFPSAHIVHIIRNPFSAYRDTKRRPFPQSLSRYLITWNIYHSTVNIYANMYPKNVRIFRYEDLVEDKESFMRSLASFIGVDFEKVMLTPSWNGRKIEGSIAPWGTVLKSDKAYNEQVIRDLSEVEINEIAMSTIPLAKYFGYDQVPCLKKLYNA